MRKAKTLKRGVKSQMGWKFGKPKKEFIECTLSGSKSREDGLAKIENNLVPLCDEFLYLG